MTCGEAFKALVSWLQAKDLVPEDYMCIDYPDVAHPDPKAEWPRGRVICYCVPGDSEGYYVHVSVLQPAEGSSHTKHVPVFTGKTFRRLAFGLAVATECTTFFHKGFDPD